MSPLNKPPVMEPVVNDFVVKFANVNGSGSASANSMFAKAIFRMGIPVSPRNIFPSNIQGAPTWYEVRISEQGYLGRRGGQVELMVSVNPQSMADDVNSVCPGGYFFYDNTYPLDFKLIRDDIHYIGLPLTEITNNAFSNPRLQQLFKNIIYVGSLAYLIGIEFEALESIVNDTFKRKPKLIPPNIEALQLGFDEAKKVYDNPLPLQLKRSHKNDGKVLLEGNAACGLGAVYGGATVCAWYPITPSTSVAEGFEKYAKRFRIDPETGKNNFAIVQAEDELSAIGMVIGANWNGARSFTATSGPGVSLMQEFLGLAYFAEIPAVLIDVQRTGPSTGMPTRTQQSDILISAYASHGDTKQVLLFPATPKECFELTADAFDIAERLQTPVIMLTDLDLGMNEHICDNLVWDDTRSYDRGKLVSAEDLDNMGRFGRYLDVDGDGIPYRTVAGTHPEKGAYFTRGTSRDEYAVYTEKGEEYQRNMERLEVKWATAPQYLPKPIETLRDDSNSVGVIHFGTSNEATREALETLTADGHAANDLRVLAFPFHAEVLEFIERHDKIFVVEQNRDAQFKSLLVNELEIHPKSLTSVLHYNGDPISARVVRSVIESHLETSSSQPSVAANDAQQ
ncbi:2-oxoacid:acceptor oxidoreductase subunit alpha [Arenicella xantha]|uniref:2-oxoglutarate ferredoxin oxidoreductase subunit alpha n=1 Tax=Arenicella xantha TaxID=644221 RepID=A0A395JQ34_9GAMM|nr:2-oxoacid:acceptor oxidoreductase subunit alpha [Arenicella xantha]RBP52735.1 2-oxoglutarate ferredoxin oxidoreductase subunit alpha [Arenicella xantha]